MATKNTIEISGLQLNFNNRRVLGDIYMKFDTQQIVGLLGLNGQGKSCLMNVLFGTLNAEYSSIRINGIDYKNLYKQPDLVSYLPQHPFIPSAFTLKKIFSDFGLSHSFFFDFFPEYEFFYKTPIGKLSGGQRRFIEVYSIVKSKSKFSLLDEPFTHLMPIQIEKITNIILEEKLYKGFLISDHLFNTVIEFSDLIYVLKNGKTHCIKNTNDLMNFGYIKNK